MSATICNAWDFCLEQIRYTGSQIRWAKHPPAFNSGLLFTLYGTGGYFSVFSGRVSRLFFLRKNFSRAFPPTKNKAVNNPATALAF